jgi:hypothetical protein
LSGGGEEDMVEEKVPNWESELWSYISDADGEYCPLYSHCRLRLQGNQCLSDDKKYFQRVKALLDNDKPVLSNSELGNLDFIRCAEASKIFQLVTKLAYKYIEIGKVHSPPVPTLLITMFDTNSPIEVREVPLRAYHGAVWYLRNKWIIHLNKNDTPARKRFSLFHEAFHILAHSKATPVFSKVGVKQGSFNEMLAEHFAGCILMPRELAMEKWAECHSLKMMAEIFQIPKILVWFGLKGMGLFSSLDLDS